MTKPILCVGALTCDLTLHLPSLPATPGKYLANRSTLLAAGMAASAATAIARLGQPVALWASVGDDHLGDFAVAEVAAEGIDTRFIRRLRGIASPTAAILVDREGERVVVPYYDPALLGEPAQSPPVAGAFGAVMTDVRWPAAARLALDAARSAQLPAILDLDVGPREILVDLACRATHIVASLAGAAVLSGSTNVDACLQAVRRHAPDAALLAVTDGENGVWYVDASGTAGHLPAFAIEAVDTNAAGDIFHGAFAVACVEQAGAVEALRFASAAAAIKCTRYGGRSGAPSRGEVDAFLIALGF